MISTLAPWRLEVIVDRSPLVDAADAQARGEAMSARFVVWRRDGVLVVFDRERRSTEQRACANGPLNAVGAATAALTVKTLMRLPPPPPPEEPSPEQAPSPDAGIARAAPPPRGLEIRVQAGLAARVAPGSDVDPGGRLAASVYLRPWADRGWRFGAAFELGTAADVKRASFDGTWSDQTAHVLASWTHSEAWREFEGQLGAGFARASLVGDEASASRRERATLPLLRAGVVARARIGRWSPGVAAAIDWLLDPPTYDRVGSSARIFTAPAYGLSVGIVVAADFEAGTP